MKKVYSHEYISVDIVTPARRLLVSNGLRRLEVCAVEIQSGAPTDGPSAAAAAASAATAAAATVGRGR